MTTARSRLQGQLDGLRERTAALRTASGAGVAAASDASAPGLPRLDDAAPSYAGVTDEAALELRVIDLRARIQELRWSPPGAAAAAVSALGERARVARERARRYEAVLAGASSMERCTVDEARQQVCLGCGGGVRG